MKAFVSTIDIRPQTKSPERVVTQCLYASNYNVLAFLNEASELFEEARPFRFPMMSEQIGRFCKGVWCYEYAINRVEQFDHEIIVLDRVCSQPAVLGD